MNTDVEREDRTVPAWMDRPLDDKILESLREERLTVQELIDQLSAESYTVRTRLQYLVSHRFLEVTSDRRLRMTARARDFLRS
jgi:response regulator of citrate/malate metabolism